MALAVAVTLACPEASVVAEVLIAAEAPEAGGANVTAALGTTLPSASLTTTRSGAVKAVPTVVDCGVPLTTAIDAGAPAVLVSENDAGVPTPATVALTE
jgi:hypothetical protein